MKRLLIWFLFAIPAFAQSPLNVETTSDGLTQNWASGSIVNRGQIVKVDSTGRVVPMLTTDTTGAVGVAVTSAQNSGQTVKITANGDPLVQMDGACVLGNQVSISSTVAGTGHCSASASTQTIGVVSNLNGNSATFVNVHLGPFSTAGSPAPPASSVTGPGSISGTFTGGPISIISTVSESSVTVTVTTVGVCLYTSGMVVNISGVSNALYNGNYEVIAGCGGGNTFTYYNQSGLSSSSGGTVTGSPIHSSGLTVTGLLITGTGLPAVLPVNPINLGNYCGVGTGALTSLPYGINSPCTTTSLNLGAPPVANGAGFAVGHRNDVQTSSGYDVVTSAAGEDIMTCQGTNSGGTQTDNATNCVAIFGNAASFGVNGSVNPIASDFYATSAFTGTGTHLVQSMQNLLKTARTPGWFGDTANDYSPMNTFNIAAGSQNISAFLGMTSSAAGKGAKTGAFITDTIDTADAIWHGANIARPTTGRWCAASVIACEFFGAGAGYSTLQANGPLYSDSPAWGTVYGEMAANSGVSQTEAFWSTTAGTTCTPLAAPNGASEVGNTITITCNAAISGDFAGAGATGPVSVAHITGMGVSGYNIDCPIQTVSSPSFTCIDSNITTSGFTITGASEAAGTVTITTSATCPFTTGETVTIANVVNGSPLVNNGYNGAFTVLTPGCNGGSTFTYTNSVTGLPTCSSQGTCAGPINATAVATGNPLPASGGGSVVASTRQAFTSQFDAAGVHHFGYASPPSTSPTNKINFTMGSAATTQQTLVSSTVTAIVAALSAGAVQMGSNSNHRVDTVVNGNPLASLSTTGALSALGGHYSTSGVVGGTACTNGELALSAGFGTTATVTAVAGINQTCHWTITSNGTGQAANPTITDTLVIALPAATIVCDMRMEGGTGTATLINQSTLSSTAPVFTFNGTPVAASTYIVIRRCGP